MAKMAEAPKMRNVFFFDYVNNIGGVETMFWELAKKYHNKFDITVYYRTGDPQQIRRLSKLVRVRQYNGGEVECERAFFNYNLEPFLSHTKASHYYEIIHADFRLQRNLKPHTDPRINTYLAVSERVADSFQALTGIECEVCPNPLTLEEVKHPPLFLCSAQRMTSEKGGNRIKELVKRLDGSGIPYYYLIFTNDKTNILSKNVATMQQRLDVRPYICGCDLFVALSDSEGRCYSVGEKLGYGTGKMLITPCPSFFEQGCDDSNSIVLDFDLSNMDEVIEKIREYYESRKVKHSFTPIKNEDWWHRYLAKGKPTYIGGKTFLVEATDIYQKYNIFDTELQETPIKGRVFKVDGLRLETLLNYSLGALVKVIGES